MQLTHKDYAAILLFYNKDPTSMSKTRVKQVAEQLLANKLCRCIKKVNKDEKQAISICTDSVLRKKNLRSYGFRCKKGARLLPAKGVGNRATSKKLSKIKRKGRGTRKY